MKNVIFALAASLAFAGSALAKETKTTLKVTGWHCAGCAGKTEASLKKVSGVTSVTTNKKSGTAIIEFDDAKVQVADLEKVIVDEGFAVAK